MFAKIFENSNWNFQYLHYQFGLLKKMAYNAFHIKLTSLIVLLHQNLILWIGGNIFSLNEIWQKNQNINKAILPFVFCFEYGPKTLFLKH